MLEIEPHVGGVRALQVPSTGITDYSAVTAKYAEIATGRGAEVRTNAGVVGFERSGQGVGRGGGPNASGRFYGALCGELRGAV